MDAVNMYLNSLVESCAQFHDRHPVGTSIFAGAALVGTVFYYLYNRNLERSKFHLEQWGCYEIERGVKCNNMIKDGKLLEHLPSKLKTMGPISTAYECFLHGYAISKNRRFLGRFADNFTRYEWLTYSEVRTQAELTGKFLRSSGILRQQNVGLYASNCCEWVITEIACILQSLVAVPLYDTLGLESIRHVIKEVEMSVMFSDSEKKLKRILEEIENFPALKMFVLLSDKVEDSSFVEQCKARGVRFLTWSEAQKLGAEHPEIGHDPPTQDDTFVIQYTSGTTGISKGAIITHRNTLSALGGLQKIYHVTRSKNWELSGGDITPDDCQITYLPLAHVYGQLTAVAYMWGGASLAFSSGNPLRLLQDCQVIKPTFLPLVPRIMNRVYSKIVEETKCDFKGWLFWKCYERKRVLVRQGIVTRESIYDWLVFRKLQNLIGGKIRLMATGSAPLSAEVLEFWRVVFGVVIVEGYGQTESTPCVTLTAGIEGGNVGYATPCCMVRLLDLPELGYTLDHNPPQGEICVKGPIVMPGYYKRPELTKETFTPDGWLLTGDIGEFLEDGALRIIDRRKHIFKLSQGEYIAPEKIESVYVQCPLVAQVFVDGSSFQTYPVAIVVPEEKDAMEWAVKHGLVNASFSDVCANKEFQRYVFDAMLAVGKKRQLNSLEQVKSLYLFPEAFSVANGLLTPTMKNKRTDLHRRFLGVIDELYKAGPLR